MAWSFVAHRHLLGGQERAPPANLCGMSYEWLGWCGRRQEPRGVGGRCAISSPTAHPWAGQLQTDLLVLRNMSGAQEWRDTSEFTVTELFEDTLAHHAFLTADPRFLRVSFFFAESD